MGCEARAWEGQVLGPGEAAPAVGGSRAWTQATGSATHETLQETKGRPQGGPGRQTEGEKEDTAGRAAPGPTAQQALAREGRKGCPPTPGFCLPALHPPPRSPLGADQLRRPSPRKSPGCPWR